MGKKVGEKVGEKTGEKVGESLGEIDKLNLCPQSVPVLYDGTEWDKRWRQSNYQSKNGTRGGDSPIIRLCEAETWDNI